VKDGETAVTQALELRPNVVLMDVNMPELNGLMATQVITTSVANVAVIVLTAYDDEEQMFFALRAGASAYFVKDVLPEELVQAIRVVSAGRCIVNGKVLTQAQLQRWLSEWIAGHAQHSGQDTGSLSPLSSREMEVLEYLVQGASNKAIASNLGISQQTVKNHMTNILRKLGAGDRTEAAVVALRRGWIPLQSTRASGSTPEQR
jgi:DNA-binding NarL/FixJ family response regulator